MFVSTEDAASGIFLPDMKKELEKKEEYRIPVKLLRTEAVFLLCVTLL